MRLSAVSLLVFGALVLAGCAFPPASDEALHVGLGEEFVLHDNQTAIIEPGGLEIRITNFIYSPCPQGAVCVWSGLGVGMEYKMGGKVEAGMNLVRAFGYRTEIIETDYKTYARLKVMQE
ncbi:hypothetical protein L0Y65_03855 [Candidatus Micrarchaeota archaeon]|nr:hypothetical protein [Candidatus Micrarchaeota archaeon]